LHGRHELRPGQLEANGRATDTVLLLRDAHGFLSR